jgi:hypothetical protein
LEKPIKMFCFVLDNIAESLDRLYTKHRRIAFRCRMKDNYIFY